MRKELEVDPTDFEEGSLGISALIHPILAAGFTWGWYGLILLPVVLLAMLVVVNAILERIPGLTEDIYGALCEVTETVLLLCFVVMQSSL
jgi:cobalamin synthase